MRRSICVQSCESVPPSRACTERIALLASYWPPSMSDSSRLSSSWRRREASPATSEIMLSSPSATASSSHSPRSEARLERPCHCSTCAWRDVMRRMVAWAARLSSQKPGCCDSSVSLAISLSLTGKSKTHLERMDAGADIPNRLGKAIGGYGGSGHDYCAFWFSTVEQVVCEAGMRSDKIPVGGSAKTV